MKVTETKLKGVYVVEPQVFGDERGWFMESWSRRKLEEAGLQVNFVQDNQSFSAQKGILRGLHYQKNPMCQAKMVRCTRGRIFDISGQAAPAVITQAMSANGRPTPSFISSKTESTPDVW